MLIVSNWKAYVSDTKEAKRLFEVAKKKGGKNIQIVLAPPAPFLGMLAQGNRSKISFAGQAVSPHAHGAHTGEVSAETLYACGARYVIVGHSERRKEGETNQDILTQMKNARIAGLTPILCVGETERDEEGVYLSFIRAQIQETIGALSPKERIPVIVAYEPVWAIGKSAKDAIGVEDLTQMILYIRKILSEYLPRKTADTISILYGGSVEAENISTLSLRVDGFLVGRASAEVSSFTKLLNALS